MPDPSGLAVFVTAAIALLVVPGPSVLYIVARSMEGGRTAGLVSVLGIHTGSIVHVVAAAVGLSALLVSSAVAFSVVKYLGAAYLIYLGVRKLMARDDARAVDVRADGLWHVYSQGVIVNVLNPKTALFFLAFLPQFVDPARGGVTAQIIVLGLVFMGLGMVSDGLYALIGAGAGRWLRRPRMARAHRLVTGGVYVSLGVTAAATGSKSSG